VTCSNKIAMSAFLIALACGAAAATPIGAAQRAALNACVVRAAGEMKFNGAVYLAQPGDPVVAKNFGASDAGGKIRITDNTRFNIASAGKMFTAIAIGLLVERGKIAFDAPIGRYLPGLDPQTATITVSQLLLHTSGLGDYFTPANMRAVQSAKTAADLLPLALAAPLAFAPGSKIAYSNSGFVVLGAIVEKISGMSYAEFVRKEIFIPLGMTNTRPTAEGAAEPMTRMSMNGGMLDQPEPSSIPPSFASPAGGMFSTVSDMSRFLTALANHQLIKAGTLAALFRPRAHPPARVGHNGGTPGANAEIWFYPDSGWQLIALSNYDPPVATRMAVVLEQAMLATDTAAACTAALAAPPPQMPLAMPAPRQ
jgi:D-alanyl-D-alanine carboxypeptidase